MRESTQKVDRAIMIDGIIYCSFKITKNDLQIRF